jgi:flagellar basal body-associated protein FliL
VESDGSVKLNLNALIIAGAVVGAMSLEAALLLVFMPAQPAPVAGSDDPADSESTKGESTSSNTVEEPIGEAFKCTNNRAKGSVVFLNFKVAVVLKDGREAVEFREFLTKYYKTRVRQAIEKTARNASMEDLYDPHLSTLKRLIREDVNKVMTKSYVIEVIINDFQMTEQ